METVEETPLVVSTATSALPTKTPMQSTVTPPATNTPDSTNTAIPIQPTETSTPASEGTKVLIVIRNYESLDMPYMTDNELGVMIDMLNDAGFEHSVTSVSYDPYESETRTITPDLLIGAVDVADFIAVVLPCLALGESEVPQEISELVEEFHEQEKLIAAQKSARTMLYWSDIIANDQMISKGVLKKGSVITSACCPYMARSTGCEDGTSLLIDKLITTLS